MTHASELQQQLQQLELGYWRALQWGDFQSGFLARTAHELRGPLGGLMSLHQLITCDLCDSRDEEQEFISHAYEYVQKVLKLIDTIVLVSKMDYGNLDLVWEPLNLKELFQQVEPLLNTQSVNYHTPLHFIPPATEIQFSSDRQALQQLMVLLIDGMINKEDNATITIHGTLSTDGPTVEINLDYQGQINIWQEPSDLDAIAPEVTPDEIITQGKTLDFSPGMKWLLAEKLVHALGGELVLTIPDQDALPSKPITRLQCRLPQQRPTVPGPA